MSRPDHWADDPYWIQALEAYYALRAAGTSHLTLDLAAIEAVISDEDGIAYRLMFAMESVRAHEEDGLRGTPRLVLAALTLLASLPPVAPDAP